MRLSVISEDFSPKEFYDFYALLYAYQTQMRPDEQDTIKRRLEFETNHLFADLMRQVGAAILERLGYDQAREVVISHGARYEADSIGVDRITNIDQLDIPAILLDLLKWAADDESRYFGGFTSGNGRWVELAKEYLRLTSVSGLNPKIEAIDKIFGLLHHGGKFTDYFDERRWIEDALNNRANLGIAGLLKHASSSVRELLGPVRMEPTEVSPLQKLFTSLERLTRNLFVNVQTTGSSITMTGRAELWCREQDGRTFLHSYVLQRPHPHGMLNKKEHDQTFEAVVSPIPLQFKKRTHRMKVPDAILYHLTVTAGGKKVFDDDVPMHKRHYDDHKYHDQAQTLLDAITRALPRPQ